MQYCSRVLHAALVAFKFFEGVVEEINGQEIGENVVNTMDRNFKHTLELLK